MPCTRASPAPAPAYLQLVEGYRDTSGRGKRRVVASLGRVDKLGAHDLDPLIQGLQRAVGRPSTPGAPPEFEPARRFSDL
jgi:hypothetical protein